MTWMQKKWVGQYNKYFVIYHKKAIKGFLKKNIPNYFMLIYVIEHFKTNEVHYIRLLVLWLNLSQRYGGSKILILNSELAVKI